MTAPQIDSTAGDTPVSVTPADALSRRLLLRRSLGVATPVVLTLASLPSHAAAGCVNPSGFISNATFNSRHPGGVVCTTNGPTYFSSLDDALWPKAGNVSSATQRFAIVFKGSPSSSRSTTLKEILIGPYSNYAKYCVAAYANALRPPVGYPMTVDQASALWVTIKGGGSSPLPAFPQPSLGWDETKTLNWLTTVMNP
jgi:hypothetical protein